MVEIENIFNCIKYIKIIKIYFYLFIYLKKFKEPWTLTLY